MKEKQRYLFLDIARGLSLLVMFEAHVFNALLKPALKQQLWFEILTHINGLIAPVFLFVSGAVFVISTRGKTDLLRKFDKYFWRKAGKIVMILLAGYSLHLPYLSLYRLRYGVSEAELMHFYIVDILHCIAAGLFILLVVRTFVRNEKALINILTALALLIIFISPYIWGLDISYLPVYLTNFLNPHNGSHFPLLPWLGFLLCGSVFSFFFVRAEEKGNESRFFFYLFITGIILIASGHLLLSPLMPYDFGMIRPHPVFFFERLGYTFVIICFCFWGVNKWGADSWILNVSRSSLLVYWMHLQLIYRPILFGVSLFAVSGQAFGIIQSSAAYIIITSIMLFAAWLWERFKREQFKAAQWITAAVYILCVIIFLIN